ncbi:MAG: hypothetical protein RQ869_01440 [Candidatus Nanopusillus sp.]|nr:hypothetical protein [Candidatus Nanopusillus sp.]
MDNLSHECKYTLEIIRNYYIPLDNRGIELSKLYEVAYGYVDNKSPVVEGKPNRYFRIIVDIERSIIHDNDLNRKLDWILKVFDDVYGRLIGEMRVLVNNLSTIIDNEVRIKSYRVEIKTSENENQTYELEIIGKNNNKEKDILIRLDINGYYINVRYLEPTNMEKIIKCGIDTLRSYAKVISDGIEHLNLYNHELVNSLSIEVSSAWVGERLRLSEQEFKSMFLYGLNRKIKIEEIEDRLIPPHKDIDETERNVSRIYVDNVRVQVKYNEDKIIREDDVYVFYSIHNCRKLCGCKNFIC